MQYYISERGEHSVDGVSFMTTKTTIWGPILTNLYEVVWT